MVEVAETAPPEGVQKRRYVKVPKGDFIKIANASNSIWEIVDKTGMTYEGVSRKIKTLRGSNVALKKVLFERQKRTKRAAVAA